MHGHGMEVCQLTECLCDAPNYHYVVNKAADNPGSSNTEVDFFIFLSVLVPDPHETDATPQGGCVPESVTT